MSSDNAFVTLTYAEDRLPAGGSLMPKHLQNWLKRLRAQVAPLRIRFYGCGEYGDQTERPHYHVALFGYPTCVHGRSRYAGPRGIRSSCCRQCDLVRDTWGFGRVDLGTLTTESAQYVAGYVTKKMTRRDDPRLKGRHPEFARMSNRPGIGADAMWEVASQLMKFNLDCTQADVPSALRHGSRLLPLGRYLRRKLRRYIGKEETCPAEELQKLASEMLGLYASAAADGTLSTFLPKDAVMAVSDGAVAKLKARERIWKQRKEL